MVLVSFHGYFSFRSSIQHADLQSTQQWTARTEITERICTETSKNKSISILKYIHLTKQDSQKQGERVKRTGLVLRCSWPNYSVLILSMPVISELPASYHQRWVSHLSLISSREQCAFFDRSFLFWLTRFKDFTRIMDPLNNSIVFYIILVLPSIFQE